MNDIKLFPNTTAASRLNIFYPEIHEVDLWQVWIQINSFAGLNWKVPQGSDQSWRDCCVFDVGFYFWFITPWLLFQIKTHHSFQSQVHIIACPSDDFFPFSPSRGSHLRDRQRKRSGKVKHYQNLMFCLISEMTFILRLLFSYFHYFQES